MTPTWVRVAELLAAVLFILALKGLSSPKTARRGNLLGAAGAAIATAVAQMSAFGIEPRHLRSFKSAADREIGLIEQVVTPLNRQKSSDSKARAEEVSKEIAALSIRLHADLVRAGLNRPR